MLNEDLLAVWLHLTNIIDNQRLAAAPQSSLSLNEALVCGLLAQSEDCPLTASDLCRRTRILKSQMNAILHSLESRGLIARQRAQADRRRVEIRLLEPGRVCYEAAHRRALGMADRLIGELGREQAEALVPLLRRAADIFDSIQKEG